MASTIKEKHEALYHIIECPFSTITGCDYMTIINDYCTSGKHCIKDCSYAQSIEDDA